MSVLVKRSTHSDLARELVAKFADRLLVIPTGYLVSDGGTLHCIRSAASALLVQDQKIGELTIELRQVRYGGK